MTGPNFKTVDTAQKDSASLRFLYQTVPGRCVLKALVQPALSKAVGAVLDAPVSRRLIPGFIKSNRIDMRLYPDADYPSFNAFFTRQIRPECRPVSAMPTDVIAPCDGKLTVYPITENALFSIKDTAYDLEGLLDDPVLARDFAGGCCLVFRLSPDDYHRYCYTDSGKVLVTRKIPGVLHTVRPIAFRKFPVFKQNAREYSLLQTQHFGAVIQMEVGALLVGRIKNHPMSHGFSRGEERGMFEFGGSTVVMLYQKDKVALNPVFYTNTRNGLETVVSMGMALGHAL